MRYTLNTGKTVNIPNAEIEKLRKTFELTEEEAIEMWLEDEGYEDNEEQNELDEKAKAVRIDHEAGNDKRKKSKPRTVHISDEKKELFDTILKNLDHADGVDRENITVLKENKLIQVRIGEKTFKIDLIEQRPPKKQGGFCYFKSQRSEIARDFAEFHYYTTFLSFFQAIFAKKCTKF